MTNWRVSIIKKADLTPDQTAVLDRAAAASRSDPGEATILIGRKADSTVNSFSAFMRKYVTSRDDIRRELEHLYGSVRSGHFHDDQFPLGEYSEKDFSGPFMNMESVINDELNFKCQGLVREATKRPQGSG